MSNYSLGFVMSAAVIGAAAGFATGYFVCEKRYGIDDFGYAENEDLIDGDYVTLTNTVQHSDLIQIDEKPDIFEIGRKTFEDYSKTMASNCSELMNKEISAKPIKKNIFEKPDYISIVSTEEAQDLVAEGEDTLTATYFVNDDILAGFDDKLDKLDEVEYELEEGINALMNDTSSGTVYLHNEKEGVVYELMASTENYENALKEVE